MSITHNINTNIKVIKKKEVDFMTNINNKQENVNTLAEALKTLNQKYAATKSIDTETVSIIENLLKETNSETTNMRIKELLNMNTLEMFNEYINNRFVTIKKLKLDTKENKYVIVDTEKQLSFVQIEKASTKEICKGIYVKLVSIFMDNLIKVLQEEQSVKGINLPKMQLKAEYQELRKKHNFDKISMVELEKQLNTILSYLLPDDLNIKAVKADVKYLKNAMSTTKQGKTVIIKEKTFINELFVMLYHRKNKIAYSFQTKMHAHEK